MITAFKTARSVLPDYWHKFSPQKFTLPQLFACLVLRVVLKTDYRGVAVFLDDLTVFRIRSEGQIDGFGIGRKAIAAVLNAVEENDVLALGPGIGIGPGPKAVLEALLKIENLKLIIDADGLNNLAKLPDWPSFCKAVMSLIRTQMRSPGELFAGSNNWSTIFCVSLLKGNWHNKKVIPSTRRGSNLA